MLVKIKFASLNLSMCAIAYIDQLCYLIKNKIQFRNIIIAIDTNTDTHTHTQAISVIERKEKKKE